MKKNKQWSFKPKIDNKSRSHSRVKEKSVFESYGVHEHIERQLKAKLEREYRSLLF